MAELRSFDYTNVKPDCGRLRSAATKSLSVNNVILCSSIAALPILGRAQWQNGRWPHGKSPKNFGNGLSRWSRVDSERLEGNMLASQGAVGSQKMPGWYSRRSSMYYAQGANGRRCRRSGLGAQAPFTSDSLSGNARVSS